MLTPSQMQAARRDSVEAVAESAHTKGGATTTTRELECHRLRPVTTGFLTHFGPLVMPGLLHGVLGRLIGS